MLTELKQEQGVTKSLSEYFYDELTRRTSEDACDYLRRMPGVGPKTAACVLMFNLNRPVMPVDTGIYRKTVGLNRGNSHNLMKLFLVPHLSHQLSLVWGFSSN